MPQEWSSGLLNDKFDDSKPYPPSVEQYGVSMRDRAISFGPDERDTGADRSRRGKKAGRAHSSISRSRSRSRARSASNMQIEFHRMSFQISESESREKYNEDLKAKRQKAKDTSDNSHYLEAPDYHTQSMGDLYKHFHSSIEGISQAEATARLARDGKNELPRIPPSYVKKILKYIFGGFCSILWIGVIIFFICWRPFGDPDPAPYNLGLGILVLMIILLQAAFSALQDWSTARTMKAILDLVPTDAVVLRSGVATKIPSTEVVVGDVVQLSIGNKVPADLCLLTASGDVRFDRSILTGESDEIEGSLEASDTNFLESRNVALMGTMVTNGNAIGIAVLTGKNTVMGHITVSSSSIKEQPTLIQREITRFVYIIVGLAVFLAVLLVFTRLGWLRKDHFEFMNVVDMLDDVMGCVVAFIPEGMPVGVALTLMMVARRMKNNNILPKGLSNVETLGCVNVICSDKTGTLTENRMSVITTAFVDLSMPVEEAFSAFAEGSLKPLLNLHKVAALCNDATFDPATIQLPIAERKILGNPTDGAVLRFFETGQQGTVKALNDKNPRVFSIPFNSKNK
ncbi:hypothetical protein N7454_005234 [Penicillium verhagenii]|nr:hypothetical protein N7454_005234 [Penicillium verhagenii]